jgi:hypothetical protein
MTGSKNVPRDANRRSTPDDDLVTGMGGGDDPIVDGVEVESDLEENPYATTVPSGRHMQGDVRGEESGIGSTPSHEDEGNEPEDLGFDELDPDAEDRTWGA